MNYGLVDRFTGEAGTLPMVDIFPSATAIVDALIEQLSVQTAESVGIVLDESTLFSPLVEAWLAAADIPLQGDLGFIELREAAEIAWGKTRSGMGMKI